MIIKSPIITDLRIERLEDGGADVFLDTNLADIRLFFSLCMDKAPSVSFTPLLSSL